MDTFERKYWTGADTRDKLNTPLADRSPVQNTLKAALQIFVLPALFVFVPRGMLAQTPTVKGKNPSSATSTDTGGKHSKGTIEIMNFSFGASNSAVPPATGSAGPGKVSLSDIKPNSTVGALNSAYKGPIVLPPSPPKPNDSAHKHPRH